jgi:tetratricopeptide (TPR) repeat protein
MPKLDYLQQKKLNPADELRELIHYLEERRPTLKSMNSAEALTLLQTLDRAYDLFHELESAGLNLLPERGRFEAIQHSLQNKVRVILRALGGPAALSAYRPQPAPERERWWWYIHEAVAAQNQRRLRQIVIGVTLIILIVGGILLAFETVLAPSPEVVARLEAENDALSFLEDGGYQEALVAVEEGLAAVPDDPGLLTFKGILLELLGQEDEAARSFQAAQANLAQDPTAFYLGRGQLYMRLGQLDKAENDARLALEVDNNSSLAWLILGQALESQDKRVESVTAYEQASELGLADGNFQVVVLARLGLGRVGLIAPAPPTPTGSQE